MSQGTRHTDLQRRTEQLLAGPLKHIKAAALAAALLPLASVAATEASAQTGCAASAGVCGIVFDDANNNGVQDAMESGLPEVKVIVTDGTSTVELYTNPDGTFGTTEFPGGTTTTIFVEIPEGTQPSPTNVGDDTFDSDGESDGNPYYVFATNPNIGTASDFGFYTPAVSGPGTGTPGYWKNHPEAWPVASLTVGGVTYSKDQAIAWLSKVGKDKTTTMFSSLVPAMLNVLAGNNGSCVTTTITAANAWMATYGPVGRGISGGSEAWALGEPLHQTLDAYNNGRLCAPHRN